MRPPFAIIAFDLVPLLKRRDQGLSGSLFAGRRLSLGSRFLSRVGGLSAGIALAVPAACCGHEDDEEEGQKRGEPWHGNLLRVAPRSRNLSAPRVEYCGPKRDGSEEKGRRPLGLPNPR